eukprot:SAG11_NODE_37557_length_256_cov_0.974522_1_plen_63_part_10
MFGDRHISEMTSLFSLSVQLDKLARRCKKFDQVGSETTAVDRIVTDFDNVIPPSIQTKSIFWS